MFQEGADISTIRTVTVTNWEEMTMLEAHDMRVCNVSVLVDLVRIVWWNTPLSCKRELRDYVNNLLFTWIWSSFLVLFWLDCSCISRSIVSRFCARGHRRLWVGSTVGLLLGLRLARAATLHNCLYHVSGSLSRCIVRRIFWAVSPVMHRVSYLLL